MRRETQDPKHDLGNYGCIDRADREEYVQRMMRFIAEFNSAERDACREYMLTLMKANKVGPETHYMILNVNDIPPHWRQHMPEFVRLSPLITSGQVYFADRKTFDLIAGS